MITKRSRSSGFITSQIFLVALLVSVMAAASYFGIVQSLKRSAAIRLAAENASQMGEFLNAVAGTATPLAGTPWMMVPPAVGTAAPAIPGVTAGTGLLDAYGNQVVYCPNAAAAADTTGGAVAFALISPGKDGIAQTSCAQAISGSLPQSDDVVVWMNLRQVAQRSVPLANLQGSADNSVFGVVDTSLILPSSPVRAGLVRMSAAMKQSITGVNSDACDGDNERVMAADGTWTWKCHDYTPDVLPDPAASLPVANGVPIAAAGSTQSFPLDPSYTTEPFNVRIWNDQTTQQGATLTPVQPQQAAGTSSTINYTVSDFTDPACDAQIALQSCTPETISVTGPTHNYFYTAGRSQVVSWAVQSVKQCTSQANPSMPGCSVVCDPNVQACTICDPTTDPTCAAHQECQSANPPAYCYRPIVNNYAVEVPSDCTTLFPGVSNGCLGGDEGNTYSGFTLTSEQSNAAAEINTNSASPNWKALCNLAGYTYPIFGTVYPHNINDNNFWASSGQYFAQLTETTSGGQVNVTATNFAGFHVGLIISHLWCANNLSAQPQPTCAAATLNGDALPPMLVIPQPATFADRKTATGAAVVPGNSGFQYECLSNSAAPAWQEIPPDCAAGVMRYTATDPNTGIPITGVDSLPFGYFGSTATGSPSGQTYYCQPGGWTTTNPAGTPSTGNGG